MAGRARTALAACLADWAGPGWRLMFGGNKNGGSALEMAPPELARRVFAIQIKVVVSSSEKIAQIKSL